MKKYNKKIYSNNDTLITNRRIKNETLKRRKRKALEAERREQIR
jgi:hypothetical protein